MADSGYYTKDELAELGFREIGSNVQVSRKSCFYSFSGTIGDNSRIDDFVIMKGRVDIARFVHISAFCMVSGIGGRVNFEDCSGLACRVSVYTASDDYRSSSLSNPTVPAKFLSTIQGDVSFGVGCLVGAHSVVLPNVTVGDGATIGAFGLLKESVAEGQIMVSRSATKLQAVGMRDVARIRLMRDELVRRLTER